MIVDDRDVMKLFGVVDARDAAAFAAAFAEDGSFRFGNAPAVVGRRNIQDAVAGFFATIGGLTHEVQGVWSGVWNDGIVKSVETFVRYTRTDGSVTAAIPATSTLRLRGGQIQDFRIFADVSPLSHEGRSREGATSSRLSPSTAKDVDVRHQTTMPSSVTF